MTGRPPKPNRLKAAEGDAAKIGALKLQERIENEPQMAEGFTECPSSLEGKARDAWEFLTSELTDGQLNKRPFSLSLEALCAAYGLAMSGKDASTRLKASALFLKYCSEFGITPVSHTRLANYKAPSKKTDSIDDAMFAEDGQPPAQRLQ